MQKLFKQDMDNVDQEVPTLTTSTKIPRIPNLKFHQLDQNLNAKQGIKYLSSSSIESQQIRPWFAVSKGEQQVYFLKENSEWIDRVLQREDIEQYEPNSAVQLAIKTKILSVYDDISNKLIGIEKEYEEQLNYLCGKMDDLCEGHFKQLKVFQSLQEYLDQDLLNKYENQIRQEKSKFKMESEKFANEIKNIKKCIYQKQSFKEFKSSSKSFIKYVQNVLNSLDSEAEKIKLKLKGCEGYEKFLKLRSEILFEKVSTNDDDDVVTKAFFSIILTIIPLIKKYFDQLAVSYKVFKQFIYSPMMIQMGEANGMSMCQAIANRPLDLRSPKNLAIGTDRYYDFCQSAEEIMRNGGASMFDNVDANQIDGFAQEPNFEYSEDEEIGLDDSEDEKETDEVVNENGDEDRNENGDGDEDEDIISGEEKAMDNEQKDQNEASSNESVMGKEKLQKLSEEYDNKILDEAKFLSEKAPLKEDQDEMIIGNQIITNKDIEEEERSEKESQPENEMSISKKEEGYEGIVDNQDIINTLSEPFNLFSKDAQENFESISNSESQEKPYLSNRKACKQYDESLNTDDKININQKYRFFQTSFHYNYKPNNYQLDGKSWDQEDQSEDLEILKDLDDSIGSVDHFSHKSEDQEDQDTICSFENAMSDRSFVYQFQNLKTIKYLKYIGSKLDSNYVHHFNQIFSVNLLRRQKSLKTFIFSDDKYISRDIGFLDNILSQYSKLQKIDIDLSGIHFTNEHSVSSLFRALTISSNNISECRLILHNRRVRYDVVIKELTKFIKLSLTKAKIIDFDLNQVEGKNERYLDVYKKLYQSLKSLKSVEQLRLILFPDVGLYGNTEYHYCHEFAILSENLGSLNDHLRELTLHIGLQNASDKIKNKLELHLTQNLNQLVSLDLYVYYDIGMGRCSNNSLRGWEERLKKFTSPVGVLQKSNNSNQQKIGISLPLQISKYMLFLNLIQLNLMNLKCLISQKLYL